MTGAPEPTESPRSQVGDPPSGAPAHGEERLDVPEIRRRAIGGALAIAGRGVLLRIIGFVGGLILARILLPSDYGLVALAQSIVAIGAVVSGGGFGAALIGREAEPERDELEAIFGLQLALTIGMAIVAVAAGLFFGTVGLLVAIMALALPIDAVRTVPAVVLERRLRYGAIVKAEIVDLVAFNLLAVPLVLVVGVQGVALANVGRAVAGTAVLVAGSPVGFVPPRLRIARIRGIIGFGVAFQSVGFLVVVRDWALNVLTTVVAGSAVLGFWALASRLLSIVGLVLESLWRVTFPAVARLLDAGERPGPLLARGLNLVAVATGFFAVALAGAAPALVPVLFGDRWAETIDVLPFAAAGLFVAGPVSSCVGGYLYAVGQAGQVLRTVAAQAVTWLAVSLALLPVLGATAIGVGLLVSSIVDVVYLRLVVRRRIDLPVGRSVAWPLTAALIGTLAGQAVARALSPDVLTLVAALAVTQAVYLLVLMVVQRDALSGLVGLIREFLGRSQRPGTADLRV